MLDMRQKNVRKITSFSNIVFYLFLFFFLLPGGSFLKAEERVYSAHTAVELVPEVKAVRPGGDFLVGIHMRMDPGWHVYWLNSGDSGSAPSLTWSLPSYLSAGDIRWPYPEWIKQPPLASYGYTEETVLFVPVSVSESARLNQTFPLRLDLKWLSCKEDCIPAQASLELEVGIASETIRHPRFDELCAPHLSRIPVEDPSLKAQAVLEQTGRIKLFFFREGRDNEVIDAHFFPFSPDVLEHAAAQEMSFQKETYALSLTASDLFSFDETPFLEGVLVDMETEEGRATHSYRVRTAIGEEELFMMPLAEDAPGGKGMTVWVSVLFAFLGGLMLNLMPCVLPVLSINVLGLIQIAGEDNRRIWRHGIAFTAGIMVMFWALMAAIFILKGIGYQIGWGFQFQQPSIVVLLCALFFILAMYLWGMIRIGSGAVQVSGTVLEKKSGFSRSFFRGVLMTVCATPCTAPFMGAALGFALVRPVYEAFWVFSAMGLGMALPYALLSRFPGLLHYVPKPGRWMEQLKSFFGFLLLAPVIYMSEILGQQKGLPAVAALYYFLLLLGLTVWLIGTLSSEAGSKKFALKKTLALLVLCLGMFLIVRTIIIAPAPQAGGSNAVSQQSGVRWQQYSQEAFDKARMEGKTIFINFTAAWCTTCKVNDIVAFRDPQVIAALNDRSIVALKADWTSYDPTVTEALSRYNRNSIPLYVYYGGNEVGALSGPDPLILPEVITPRIVLDVLNDK